MIIVAGRNRACVFPGGKLARHFKDRPEPGPGSVLDIGGVRQDLRQPGSLVWSIRPWHHLPGDVEEAVVLLVEALAVLVGPAVGDAQFALGPLPDRRGDFAVFLADSLRHLSGSFGRLLCGKDGEKAIRQAGCEQSAATVVVRVAVLGPLVAEAVPERLSLGGTRVIPDLFLQQQIEDGLAAEIGEDDGVRPVLKGDVAQAGGHEVTEQVAAAPQVQCAARLADVFLHRTHLEEQERGPAHAVGADAGLERGHDAVVHPDRVVGNARVGGQEGESGTFRLVAGPPAPASPVGEELCSGIVLVHKVGALLLREVMGQVCRTMVVELESFLGAKGCLSQRMLEVIGHAVEGRFEELPARPRQAVSRGSRVVAFAGEFDILETQPLFVRLGSLLVPGEVENLLGRIVQVGVKLALPEITHRTLSLLEALSSRTGLVMSSIILHLGILGKTSEALVFRRAGLRRVLRSASSRWMGSSVSRSH